MIANEFTEATGELYQGALIELGLVLFALTIIINGVARLLVMGTTEERGGLMIASPGSSKSGEPRDAQPHGALYATGCGNCWFSSWAICSSMAARA